MSGLADDVLHLIRTRTNLDYCAASSHGEQMHAAVDLLERALGTEDPRTVYATTHKAIASAITIIIRADDSNGIIGDAIARLLEIHPRAAAAAQTPEKTLVDWMITFQFNGKVDYFSLDPVTYAPALSEAGMARYRSRLAEIEAGLTPEPPDTERWSSPHSHERFVLEWNARRLAVLDRDVDAIIRTHARDRRVAAWYEDTAKALAEIGEIDLAIDWAKQGADFGTGHQSAKAAGYWCALLAEHRPDALLDARLTVFDRWPNASTAAYLHQDAGLSWPSYQARVLDRLAISPRDAVIFALLSLKDPELAWHLAHTLDLDDARTLSDLAKAYEKVDPVAVLPVLADLVERELVQADALNYRNAARRLKKMRRLAAGTDHALEVDDLIGRLRETHRRRPRLQLEFDRAGLP